MRCAARSVDWWPYTRARLVELRERLAGLDDLVVLYVMADSPINAKTLSFIDELGLSRSVRFLSDPKSRVIDAR
jgi:hypothetical protein